MSSNPRTVRARVLDAMPDVSTHALGMLWARSSACTASHAGAVAAGARQRPAAASAGASSPPRGPRRGRPQAARVKSWCQRMTRT